MVKCNKALETSKLLYFSLSFQALYKRQSKKKSKRKRKLLKTSPLNEASLPRRSSGLSDK